MSGLLLRYRLTCIFLAIRRRLSLLVSLFRRFRFGNSSAASVRTLVSLENLQTYLSGLNSSGERYRKILTRIFTQDAAETMNPLKK